jgi:hypothetical protein
MSWNTIFGVACTISLFLPVAAILYYKIYHHRSLAALGLSYLTTALCNMMNEGILPVGAGLLKGFVVFNNYMDVPLILTALLFFCPSKQRQKPVQILTISFLLYELVIGIVFGFSPKSIVYIMGPGVLLVLVYTFYLFTRQVKITIVHRKNGGRALMLAAILFGYGCYGVVYYFYYIQRTPNVADAFLIYFITSLLSCSMMTVGIHMIRKRMKKLEEAINTRKELALFFGH